MFVVSLQSLSKHFDILPATLWHFINKNNIPILQRKPTMQLDLDDPHPFLLAARTGLQYKLPIYYTITELSNLFDMDPKTFKKYISKFNITIQNRQNKGYIYSTDFIEFALNNKSQVSKSIINKLLKNGEKPIKI
jgi:hypothetical protein